MRHEPAALLLYRPVSQPELDLIAAASWLAFPALDFESPIFYPVLDEDAAAQLAQNWPAPSSGAGYVLRCAVDADYAAQFPLRRPGYQEPEELRVPADELAEFNRNILGQIEVVAVFRAE